MTVHVALLHSIVLGPGRRLVMADLRAMAEELGYRNARTLVATGNLVFEAANDGIATIERRLEDAFGARFGRHVDIIVRSAEAWKRVAGGNPFPGGEAANVGVRIMRAPLAAAVLPKLETIAGPDIGLALVDGDLWIDFRRKPSETKLLSHLTTKKLGIGTLRNANTVNGLANMLG